MITNEKYKDTLFRKLFHEKSRALELYNALTNSKYSDTSVLKFCTLDDTLYMPRKNDLAFTLEEKLIFLVEHQASVNQNMPLRMLIYLAREYEKILDTSLIYNNALIKIPTPELIVLYNGLGNQPLRQTLKLSDAYKEKLKENFVELKVKLINIKYEMKSPVLAKSSILKGYSLLIYKIQTYTKHGMDRDEAIKLSIKECIEEDVAIKDFLIENSKEVFNMLTAEFDMDTALRVREEEGRQQGRQEGEYMKSLDIARKLIDILDIRTISEKTGLPIETVEELANNGTPKDISTDPYR